MVTIAGSAWPEQVGVAGEIGEARAVERHRHADTFGSEALAAAILDRVLHAAEVLAINDPSFRLKGRLDALRGRADERTEDST